MARLIAKLDEVDPLGCTRCGQRMSIVASSATASQSAASWTTSAEYTRSGEPPPLREILRVAEHGAGWGVPAQWE